MPKIPAANLPPVSTPWGRWVEQGLTAEQLQAARNANDIKNLQRALAQVSDNVATASGATPVIPVEHLTFTQSSPSATWTIDHPLAFRPNVVTIDSTNREIIGDVTYPTASRVVVTFGGAVAGIATLS